MNAFDTTIIHFLNQFSQRSWVADRLIYDVSDNSLIKGAVMISVFWWIWFRGPETKTGQTIIPESKIRDRQFVISSLVTCAAALFLARFLAFILPYRERPFRVPALHFRVPYGGNPNFLVDWSSFPSDHAVLYFALATSIFFVSRKLGILAYCYAFFVICLPRVYLGLHYPTDVLVGAVLGVGIACLSLIDPLRNFLTRRPMIWSERSPGTFYAALYLVTFLFGTTFNPLREILGSAWHAFRGVVHH